MAAKTQQWSFIAAARVHDIKLRRAAAIRNENDLAPGFRIPARRDVDRLARARQPARARAVSIRHINLHRVAILARTENDLAIGRNRGRGSGRLKLRRADNQTVFAANDDIRMATAVRDVSKALAIGRKSREE